MDKLSGLYDEWDGNEMWDQKAKFNPKERAKIMLDTLDGDEELQREFNNELRRRKLNKIKNV